MVLSCELKLVTDFPLSGSKFVKVGMCHGVPTVVLIDKHSVIYMNSEEWYMIEENTDNILKYFSSKKKNINDITTDKVQCSNIHLNFTTVGKMRCMTVKYNFSWDNVFTGDFQKRNIVVPIIKLLKSDCLKLCKMFDQVKEGIKLLEKIRECCDDFPTINPSTADVLNLSFSESMFQNCPVNPTTSDIFNLSLSQSLFQNCTDSLTLYKL